MGWDSMGEGQNEVRLIMRQNQPCVNLTLFVLPTTNPYNDRNNLRPFFARSRTVL